MADYFCIVEHIKYYPLDNDMLMYHNAFTYKAKMKTPTILDSYFTTLYGAADNTGKETLNIKGCIVNVSNFYSVQTSYTYCEDNEESIYFDIADQMFYIHLAHDLNPYNCIIEYGKVFGYTNDKIRYFNNIDYLPLVKSIPNFSIKVDPLRYTRQSFFGGDIVMNNDPIDGSNDGPFDSNEEFTGNDIFLYFGKDDISIRIDNLIDRGDCESTTPPMIFDETVPLLTNATWMRNAAQTHTGGFSYKATKTIAVGTYGVVYLINNSDPADMHGLVAGQTYKLGMWIYIPSGGILGSEIGIFVYDNIPVEGAEYTVTFAANIYDAWQYVEVTKTIRATAIGIMLRIVLNFTAELNEYFYVDDVTLIRTDAYNELILIANNYIENTIISMDEIILKTTDKREQQSKNAPTETFQLTDFPDLDPDLDGEIKPDGYGRLLGVPGICIDSEQAGIKEFYFASIITAAPAPVFMAENDKKWIVIIPTVTDYPNGMATFAIADIHVDGDNTKGILDVRCDGYFRPYYNPADIIADLNDRFLNISYNDSNYNTVEWEDEKQYLEDVGLYMDDEKEIFKWIEYLQNGSTVGFQYLFIEGKRTIRLDNPNRDSVRTIYSVEILNDLQFDNNEQLFATHAVVLYRKNQTTEKTLRLENTDYYNAVIAEHRKDSVYKTESLLYTEDEADDKSVIIMEDQQKERPIGRLVLHGKEFFELLLFDIIDAEISKPGQKTGEEIVDVYIEGDAGDDTYVETDGTGIDIYIDVDYTKRDIIINYREFLGWMRFQIIGLFPDFNTGNMEIEVRQRDYSELFENITGYLPT